MHPVHENKAQNGCYLKAEAVEFLNCCKSHHCEVTSFHHILTASAYSLRCQ